MISSPPPPPPSFRSDARPRVEPDGSAGPGGRPLASDGRSAPRRLRRRRAAAAIAVVLLVPAIAVLATVGISLTAVHGEGASALPRIVLPGSGATGAAAPGQFAGEGAGSGSDGELGLDDGYIATGTTISPFDDQLPAIAKLDPALRAAVQEAATAASADGVELMVTSGWRSRAYQQRLFDDAVAKHGQRVGSRLVSAPGTSSHESGSAVDIGWTAADDWMMRHGDRYGLCQIYANEIWHFELATTRGGECPAQLPDATSRR